MTTYAVGDLVRIKSPGFDQHGRVGVVMAVSKNTPGYPDGLVLVGASKTIGGPKMVESWWHTDYVEHLRWEMRPTMDDTRDYLKQITGDT